MWRKPKELDNTKCLVPMVKGCGGSAMLWSTFSWHCFGAVIPLEGKIYANSYDMILSDHLHLMLQHFFPAGRGVFQDDNDVMVYSVTRSEPNLAFKGYSGMTPETTLSTSIKQV